MKDISPYDLVGMHRGAKNLDAREPFTEFDPSKSTLIQVQTTGGEMKFYYESDGDEHNKTHYVVNETKEGNDIRIDCKSKKEGLWLAEQLNKFLNEALAEKDVDLKCTKEENKQLWEELKQGNENGKILRARIKELEEQLKDKHSDYADAVNRLDEAQAKIKELEDVIRNVRNFIGNLSWYSFEDDRRLKAEQLFRELYKILPDPPKEEK